MTKNSGPVLVFNSDVRKTEMEKNLDFRLRSIVDNGKKRKIDLTMEEFYSLVRLIGVASEIYFTFEGACIQGTLQFIISVFRVSSIADEREKRELIFKIDSDGWKWMNSQTVKGPVCVPAGLPGILSIVREHLEVMI